MERRLPKNVKQIGNVSDTPKVYVEDYVKTYLNELSEKEGEMVSGAFLVGEQLIIEDQECIYVTGAIQIRELEQNDREPNVTKAALEVAKLESKEYFHGQEIIGWFLTSPDRPGKLSGHIQRIHEVLFPGKNSLFVLRDGEGEETFYVYKFHELMRHGGHYIYYEKNPDMQGYMINERKQIGVTPSEMVEDRAAKDFRSTIRGHMEVKEKRRESRYIYLTSVLLVVVVLAIGISTMNNYDKINSVQDSIETLSEVMKNDKGQEGTSKKETIEEPERVAEEQKEEINMEPVVSTIQEELNGAEYYIVQRGDTLDTISRRIYGTTSEADAICRMNGLQDGNLIFIGQKLLLP